MKSSHKAALGIASLLLVSAVPVSAQDVEHHQTVNRSKVVRTVPGHVSTNKVRVVHVHKSVHVPAKPAPAGAVHHTTVTRSVHKTSSSGPAPDHH